MVDCSKIVNMGAENGRLNEEISVCDHIHGLQYTSTKPDSFVVDMERFSHIMDKDTLHANSRITLQRNLSRKGSLRGGEKKINSNASNQKETNLTVTSPKGGGNSLIVGGTTPEKGMANASDHDPQGHGRNSIVTATAESKISGKKRFISFRRSIDPSPRRILFFFATLSSMGTILLIYFTLSMAKLSGDDSDFNG